MTAHKTNTRYRQVKERMREEFKALGPNSDVETLFTQVQLQARYGVSRPTISKALSELAAEGVIVRGTGRGSYVPAPAYSAPGKSAASEAGLNAIGFVAPSFAVELPQQACDGVSRTARRRGYQVMMATGGTLKAEREAALGLVAAGVRGLVIYPHSRTEWDDAPEYLGREDLGVPYVLVDTGTSDQGPVHVEFDNRRAACDITRRLIAQGHRRIATILSVNGYRHPGLIARSNGYADGIRDAGIEYDPALVKTLHMTAGHSSLADVIGELLALPNPPTAIMGLNEALSIDVIQELQHHGIRVPDEIIVTGFDLTAISKHFQPAFITTDPDFEYMGEVACQKLLEAVESGEALAASHYILPVPVCPRKPEASYCGSETMPRPEPLSIAVPCG